MDFLDLAAKDLTVTRAVLACRVPAGGGECVHNDRPSHGLALHVGGEKCYRFSDGRALHVKKGDLIFLPEGANYIVQDIEAGECYAVNFKLLERETLSPFVFHTKSTGRYLDLFSDAERIFREMKAGYLIGVKARLYALIAMLTEEYRIGYLPQRTRARLSPALDRIHASYAEETVEIDALAALCGMKSSYFRRLFLRSLGVSPVKYINSLRLARAKQLLLESEYSVERIGEMAGFRNLCYFHRFFKKEVGMTPTEYRSDSPAKESGE